MQLDEPFNIPQNPARILPPLLTLLAATTNKPGIHHKMSYGALLQARVNDPNLDQA